MEYSSEESEENRPEEAAPEPTEDTLVSCVNSFAGEDFKHVGQLAVKISFRAAANEIKADSGVCVSLVPSGERWQVKIDDDLSVEFSKYLDAARAFIDGYAKHRG